MTPTAPNNVQYLSPKTALLTDIANTKNRPLLARLFGLSAYHWVLFASFISLMVHAFHLPIWLTVVGMISLTAQKLNLKNARIGNRTLGSYYGIMQFLVFFGGLAGIWLSFARLFSLDVSISFLLLCMIGKVWELKSRRDAFVMLNINLFVLASAFLWTQDVLMAIGVAIAVGSILMGFVILNDMHNATGKGRFRAVNVIAVPALPLLVVLFLFFPRISPLWSMPMATNQATTGMSDSMSPGDFSNLSKSTELAFRVEFDGQVPDRHNLYWRAMVFSDFDGITWRANPIRPAIWRSFQNAPDWAKPLAKDKGTQTYRVLMQPNHQHWLASLEHSRLLPEQGLSMSDEYTMRSFAPVVSPTNYQARYLPKTELDRTLSKHYQTINLALPKNGNPKARQFAQTMMNKAGGDPYKFVALIKNHIQSNSNNFRYTLSPPLLQNDRIDEFLFGSQAGFCEHYSSSFTFLARSAGIPARVVVGYQGGELGRDGKSWEVRQMDAHAWSEIWTAEDGWVRIDPTAFVSPERIEDGMDSLTNTAGSEMFGDGITGTIGYQQFKLLQSLRRYSDQASYYWQKNIVGFDQSAQQDALSQLFNIKTLAEQLTYLIGAFGSLSVLLMGYFWYKRQVKYHPLDVPFVHLSNQLAKMDGQLARGNGEPIIGYLHRVGGQFNNDHIRQTADELARAYRGARFGATADNSKAYELKKGVNGLVGQIKKGGR